MPRDILSEYGKDIPHPQAPRATSGGCTSARDVMNYKAPVGPTNINDPKGPGCHGDNHGMAQRPVANRGSGGPGSGGTVHRSGSQRG
jgi:hypothetical protein